MADLESISFVQDPGPQCRMFIQALRGVQAQLENLLRFFQNLFTQAQPLRSVVISRETAMVALNAMMAQLGELQQLCPGFGAGGLNGPPAPPYVPRQPPNTPGGTFGLGPSAGRHGRAE